MIGRAVLTGLWLAADFSPAEAVEPPRFVEEAEAAGFDHSYDGGWEFFVGGGVAVFDCDGDRRPDVYLAGGTSPAALYRNDSPTGGALSFTRLDATGAEIDQVTGAYPLDLDGDGLTDLAVLRLGENVLLRGLGDCRFERANEVLAFDGGEAWTTAFTAKWEVGATLPTLAFGNYVDRTAPGAPFGTCDDNALIRPAADAARYAAPILLSPSWCTLSLLFTDWDRSGDADLRVSNDRQYYRGGEEQLWRVTAGEPPRQYGRDEGWNRVQIWGMGIASHDLTGDGYPEVFLTSMGDNKLQTLAAGPSEPDYRNISLERGTTAQRPHAGGDVLPSTAWHAEFQDVNNDTFIDLFIAKGNVDAMQDFAQKDPSNLLIGRPDGPFVEGAEEAGIVSFARARGASLADFNLDGMLDLITVNREANVGLWRSIGWGTPQRPMPMGNWVALELAQPGPNRHAVGAWVEVRVGTRTLRREVTVGGGHAGGQLGWVHFGIGTSERALVRVQWPDGEWGPWVRLFGNQFARIERGATEARLWLPPAAPEHATAGQ